MGRVLPNRGNAVLVASTESSTDPVDPASATPTPSDPSPSKRRSSAFAVPIKPLAELTRRERAEECPLEQRRPNQFRLPATTFSLAMVSPLAGASAQDYNNLRNGLAAVLVFLPHWLLAILALFAQTTFVIHVNYLTDGGQFDDCPTSSDLQSAALAVFAAAMFSDVFETLGMVMYVYYFPSPTGDVDVLPFRVKDVNGDTKALSGMPVWYKTVIVVVLLIPKLLIAVALAYFGALFIAYSRNNETLILNTLALTYILEIDEQIYKATTAEVWLDRIENLPRVPHPDDFRTRSIRTRWGKFQANYGSWGNAAILIAFAFGVQRSICFVFEED